jgi:hypothetical protein
MPPATPKRARFERGISRLMRSLTGPQAALGGELAGGALGGCCLAPLVRRAGLRWGRWG